jgi:hypothetical protein
VNKNLVWAIIDLLDDEDGISEKAYDKLYEFIPEDIRRSVDATDGRFYLPSSTIPEFKIQYEYPAED